MMELDEFIALSLRNIVKGVADAQEGDHGPEVNAVGSFSDSGHLIDSGRLGRFTRVDFDVAVTGEKTGGGEASVKVLGVGIAGKGEATSKITSRLTFSIPVRLPDGDESRAEEVKRKEREASAERERERKMRRRA